MVVPVLNEQREIPAFLAHLRTRPLADELIFVDGGSTDETRAILDRAPARPRFELLEEPGGSLASQLNRGARTSTGEAVVFLPVDTRLPVDWRTEVERIVVHAWGGAFRLRLDSRERRYRWLEVGAALRNRVGWGPFGDQAIFVRRTAFDAVGGFSGSALLEDLEFVRAIKRQGPFRLSNREVTASTRRWSREGFFRTTLNHWTLLARALLSSGSPKTLREGYRRYRVRSH